MTRAAILREINQPLTIEDIQLAPLAADQVRVRIVASGVCHSDLGAMNGTMAWPPPLVLGHEGAGIITAVGDDVTRVAVGDHVIVAWNQPCRECHFCLIGEPWLCAAATKDVMAGPFASAGGTDLVPFLGAATFAEETQVLARSVVKIPDDAALETAALVGCAVTTGIGAVRNTAKVEAGAKIAVIGCGGVGLSVIQGGRLVGADQIIAVDVMPDKLAAAEAFGATDVIDASDPDVDVPRAIKKATGGIGADYVFEALGRPATIRQAYQAARRGGTAVVVGVGSRHDMIEFNAMELFFMAKTVMGCMYGSSDPDVDFTAILAEHAAGRVDLDALITGHIGLEDVNDAFAAMEAGQGVRNIITF